MGSRGRGNAAFRAMAPLLVGVLCFAIPAQAQFSDGYKFLEAVRKKDGNKVEAAVNEPGSTVINTRDVTTGETALHVVTARRDRTWMSYLIAKGANVNARDGKGVTPLQLATNLGFVDGVELLIAGHANVDETNNAGETPLITAVHRHNIQLMRVLLKAGANPDKADNSGRTARDYAELDGHSSPLLAEIEKNAKAGAEQAASKSVYGPTF